jgi:hypothetical protein
MDWFSMLGQLGGVAAAIAAVWAVVETRKLRLEQASGHVIVYLETNETSTEVRDLVIHNVGQGPAFHITLTRIGEVAPFDLLKFEKTALEQEGISVLAPNRQLRFVLGADHKVTDDIRTLQLAYSPTASRRGKNRIEEDIVLRPGEFRGMYSVVDHQYQAFKSLRRAMDALRQGQVAITVKQTPEAEAFLSEEENKAIGAAASELLASLSTLRDVDGWTGSVTDERDDAVGEDEAQSWT